MAARTAAPSPTPGPIANLAGSVVMCRFTPAPTKAAERTGRHELVLASGQKDVGRSGVTA